MSAKFVLAPHVAVDTLLASDNLEVVVRKNTRPFNGTYFHNISLRYTHENKRYQTNQIKFGVCEKIEKIYEPRDGQTTRLKVTFIDNNTDIMAVFAKLTEMWKNKNAIVDDKEYTQSYQSETDDYNECVTLKLEQGNFSDKHPDKDLRGKAKCVINQGETDIELIKGITQLNENENIAITSIMVDISTMTVSTKYVAWLWSARVIEIDGDAN